jgi:hypothetical protein
MKGPFVPSTDWAFFIKVRLATNHELTGEVMTSSADETPLVDDARHWIAQTCSTLLNEGVYVVRVRIAEPNGDPTHASIYKHINNQWVQTPYSVDGGEMTLAVRAVGRMLASHPPTDSWQVRSCSSDDFEDIDLHFKRDPVVEHAGKNLLSWVTGILFKDTHASGQDRRRAAARGSDRRDSR